MTERGRFKKTIKKRLKQFVPDVLWQRLGFAALTFDKTWVGTSLSPEQINEYCQLANLDIIKFLEDPTHGSGDRVFLLATSPT